MAALNSVLNSFNYYVVEDEASTTKTGLFTSPIFSRDYGVVPGISYPDDTTFFNLTTASYKTSLSRFRPVSFNFNALESGITNTGTGVNFSTPTAVSSITSNSFNGLQLNSNPDLFNSAQNLAAGIAQTFGDSGSFVASSINSSGILNFQSSADSVTESLTNSLTKRLSKDSIKAELALLFPGVVIPGLVSILDNSDAALRAEQASQITLPQSVVDGIITKSVTGTELADQPAEILSAAQLRLASIAETSLIQEVSAGLQTSASDAVSKIQSSITATGSAINLPGTDASLSSVNSALGGGALADRVKEVESQLNAATQNALYSYNNIVNAAELQVTTTLIAPFEGTVNEVTGSVQKYLVDNVPFVGDVTSGLSEALKADLSLAGIITGDLNQISKLAFAGLTSITNAITQRVATLVGEQAAESLVSASIGSVLGALG